MPRVDFDALPDEARVLVLAAFARGPEGLDPALGEQLVVGRRDGVRRGGRRVVGHDR